MIATLIDGTLAAGGANAINMVVDRDIDRLMPRTQHRPLVTGMVVQNTGSYVPAFLTVAFVLVVGIVAYTMIVPSLENARSTDPAYDV